MEAAKRGRNAEQTIQCRRELYAAAAIKWAKDVRSQTEIAIPAQEEHPQEPPHVGVASMEIDNEIMPGKSRLVLLFLERVLFEEHDNAKGSHRLLIIVVHAALLESGFVGIDGTARASRVRFGLPTGWATKGMAGLPPPPSLVVLPMELKLKVLEFLPAIDVAKMDCMCTEFQSLFANDEPWKQKFDEEFGSPAGTGSTHNA